MAVATAALSSAIRFRKPEPEFLFEIPHLDFQPIALQTEQRPSDTKLDAMIGPVPIAARWFPIVERRISGSIATSGAEQPEEGTSLSIGVATQAIRFFQTTSDVLPADEPYLYASMEGDLVAEFKAPCGKITNVIGKSSVISFAVTDDGAILRTKIELPVTNVRRARQELRQLTEQVHSRRHAIVEP
jgi:hypothetical protein